jgi:rsbT antagonist protein RsbS
MEATNVSKIPLQLSRQCIVASIQVHLSEEVLRQFRANLLALLQKAAARGVILDVSGVEVLDLEDFDALSRTMEMAALMGARCILSGLRPGVVSSLVELNADTDEIEAALTLDEAFLLIEEEPRETGPQETEEHFTPLSPQEDLDDESNHPFTDSF